MKEYKCSACNLHYDNKKYADKCYEWCKNNKSCNLDITKHSLEVKGGKNK